MYDIIFSGGGLSALLSAYFITKNSTSKLKLLFIDINDKPLSNKTISFWSREDEFPTYIFRKQWKKISVINKDESVHQSKAYSYKTIDSQSFEKMLKEAIIAKSDSRFVNERVTGRFENNAHAFVTTTDNIYYGRFVFDSIVDQKQYLKQIKEKQFPYLTQHFLGAELRFNQAIFDDTKMVFSDFSHNESGHYEFGYLLPYSQNCALLELVSDRPVQESELENYIQRIAGNSVYEIVYKEAGCNILSNYRLKRMEGQRILRIGNAAGMLKSSTGYAFNNIVKDSKHIARHFNRESGLKKIPQPNIIYNSFDRMFLYVISQKPELVKRYLTTLFCRSKIDDVLAFLNEEITAGGFVRVTSSMMGCGIQYLLLSLRMMVRNFKFKFRNSASEHPHNPAFPR
jgi:lycopene beta-cyclase